MDSKRCWMIIQIVKAIDKDKLTITQTKKDVEREGQS